MSAQVIDVSELTIGKPATGTGRRVSFQVGAGQIHALLGPVGSGKTTVLEIVSGHRRPVAGAVRVCGTDPYAEAPALRLSTIWREGGLFPGLTVTEIVDTWRRWTLDPISGHEALWLAGLNGAAHTRFERLTLVERRRLDLALAMIGRSDVLFLDEPTADLDQTERREIWSMLRAAARRGVTILLATRDADDARRSDAVTVLAHRDSSAIPRRSHLHAA